MLEIPQAGQARHFNWPKYDAGETGSFDQIPSCGLLACLLQYLLGTMSQLDSDQINMTTSVSMDLIPHIPWLPNHTQHWFILELNCSVPVPFFGLASLSISSPREEYLTNSKSGGMG